MPATLRSFAFGLLIAQAFQLQIERLAATARDQPFDADWRFLRGDAPGAEQTAFDDSQWRTLDIPHDWSIEDLPAKVDAAPEFEAVTGQWLFQRGDNPGWKARELNDASWQTVTLPDTWENHSGYTANSHLLYSRAVAPADLIGKKPKNARPCTPRRLREGTCS